MDETLKNLLVAGKTPEAIYQDALNIVKEMNATKAKNEKVEKARTDLIKAIDLYMRALTGDPIGSEMAEVLESMLKEIEAESENLQVQIKKIPLNKSKKKETDEDAVIRSFLKSLM